VRRYGDNACPISEIRVIGRTPARVTSSHRVTPSTTPASGGLVVCHAYRQAANRSERAGVVLTAASLRPTARRAAGSETGQTGGAGPVATRVTGSSRPVARLPPRGALPYRDG